MRRYVLDGEYKDMALRSSKELDSGYRYMSVGSRSGWTSCPLGHVSRVGWVVGRQALVTMIHLLCVHVWPRLCVCPGLWKLVLTRSSPVIFANYSLVENQRVSSNAAVYSSEYLLFVVGDKVRNFRALMCLIRTQWGFWHTVPFLTDILHILRYC